MPTSLTKFKQEFEQLLNQFLWRQWSALGVAGYAESRDPWIIDPEALLLFSTVAARKDPRLFDEILDWLQQNACWMNLQRIGRISKEHNLGDSHLLAAIASHLAHNSEHNKWKTLCNKGLSKRRDLEKPKTEPVPLFSDTAHFGATDPDFLDWGFLRPPIKHRGLSQAPRCNQSTTFLFKLRSLFGRQSRAEVIAWLLAHEHGAHPAEVARQTHYFRRSVQVVLNELELSGLIRSIRRAREKHFTLYPGDWHFLLPRQNTSETKPEFPDWVLWAEVFSALQALQEVLDHPKLETMSPAMQSMQIRKAWKPESLEQSGLNRTHLHPIEGSGPEYLEATLDSLRGLLG